jgi:hypothetical protein
VQVTVALLSLAPKMEYYCVPKLVAHAFLKAKVRAVLADKRVARADPQA